MRNLRAFAPVLFFALVGAARAQLTPPTLQPGRFVYALPDSFAPPLIERAGMDQIDRELRKLKFPLYVVLTNDLPGSGGLDGLAPNSSEYNRVRAKLADDAVIGLTNRLRAQSAFDQNRGSVFLLTFRPKSFAYRPGSEWKTKYGFVTDAHKPYIDLFKRYASNPANDPKQGVIEMAKAIDAHLDDLSNPAKIAARIRDAAQTRLDGQLADARAVAKDGGTFGVEVADLLLAIDRAERTKGDAVVLDRAASALKKATDSVRQPVAEKRDAAFAEAEARRAQEEAQRQREAAEGAKRTGFLLLGGFLVVGGGAGFVARRRRFAGLREELDRALAANRERIANARQQAFRLFEERDAIAGASKFQGRTKEVYDRVATDLDALTLGLEAMASHTDASEREGTKATLFDVTPLEKAIRDIDAPFDFDTGLVNRESLYGDPTKRMTVDPKAFVAETGERFAGTNAVWEHLKRALELRGKTPEGELSPARLDELQREAREIGLSPEWFGGHPLVGDDAADRAAYAALGDLIWNDPVAGLERIEEIQKWEAETGRAFVRIRNAESRLNATRLTEVPSFPTAPVAPGDDPATLLGYAQEAEAAFRNTLGTSLETDEIVIAADEAALSYNLSREAVENLRKAVAMASQEVEATAKPLAAIGGGLKVAEETLVETARRHRGVGAARQMLADATVALAAARTDADVARQALAANRHLEAARRAAACRSHLAEADGKAKGAVHICEDLEMARAEYESKVREMGVLQASLSREGARYGTRNLTPFQAPYVSGPTDYGILYGLLAQQQASWQHSVDNARIAYEAEQEAQRQRESSSSSSSSWSSSDSSSSSSSFSSGDSGGGSSDSGGSSGDSSGGW